MSQKNIEPNPSEVEKRARWRISNSTGRGIFLGSPLRLFLVSHRNSSAITHESYYGIGRTGGGREKRDLHPWFAAEIQNGNTVDLTLKTATPWFNHPMGPTGRGYKQFYAPLMETPSLGCLLGEIEPKWHHVLTQAITRSSGQDTLENFFWTAEHVNRDTPR